MKYLLATLSALCLISPLANAGSPTHMWKCQLNDDLSEEQVLKHAADWKKAAATLPGGDAITQQIHFPVAVGADGLGTDLIYTVKWPSFAATALFGTFIPTLTPPEWKVKRCHATAAHCGKLRRSERGHSPSIKAVC